MNYHEWSKNASPYANAMSPEITCSTCIGCGTDYKRDDNKCQFNPVYCPTCSKQISQCNSINPHGIGHLDTSNGTYLDSPYGSIFGFISRYFNG